MNNDSRILWADDEIELLESHVRFLSEKGYGVTTVTNGADAVERIKSERFDLVFLDEQMPGMGGLETLGEIKGLQPDIPVVMITKSEEETIMEDAIGGQISDYLIKPVNPKQILMTCKRLLEQRKIVDRHVTQKYLRSFPELASRIGQELSPDEWFELYLQFLDYDRTLDGDDGLRQVLSDQFREADQAFCKQIESVYPGWISASGPVEGERPVLSHEVMSEFVLPKLKSERPLFFFVIDCMRYDQWLEFEQLLFPFFDIEKDYHFSILPTATPYSRNALLSGLLPAEIASRFPNQWENPTDDDARLNDHEGDFLKKLIERKHLNVRTHYDKVLREKEGRAIAGSISDYLQYDLNAIVVNFVDSLAHSRSDSPILKEIAPDERAYRALTRTWFEHSWLFEVFQELATKDCRIVVTTDHGVVRSLHGTKVIGDRDTSTSLRYKVGRNLKCDEKHAILVREPSDYGLPRLGLNTNYLLAKEDYYFVYPTNYNKYLNQYRDTMQHGGVSLHEMILPVVTMQPRS